MSKYVLQLELEVDVANEGVLRDAAFRSAKDFEDGIAKHTDSADYSVTDSVVERTDSALIMLAHAAIQQLPGVASALPAQDGRNGVRALD